MFLPYAQALDMIREQQNIDRLMDSQMEGKYPTEEATSLIQLAFRCLQADPKDRPHINSIVQTLASLQTKSEVHNVTTLASLDNCMEPKLILFY